MQAMLAMGLLTARWRPATGARLVLLTAGAWSILAGWLAWAALHGTPAF
jgi:hypothetical protein